MKTKYTYLIIIIWLVFISVLYVFSNTSELQFPKELGNGYKVDYNANGYIVVTDYNNTFRIRPHIVEFEYDSSFIYTIQKPYDSICECNSKCFENMPSYDKQSYKRCNEAFEKFQFRQFWLIDKRTGNIFGPMDTVLFEKKRNELGSYEKLNWIKVER